MLDLHGDLERLARASVLLVASDFDGTLAPIVDSPDLLQPDGEALAALRELVEMPDTHGAIVSGRSLADLASHIGNTGQIHLIGSHGSESSDGIAPEPPESALASLRELLPHIERIASQTSGCLIEKKPAGYAFHYRMADERAADEAVKTMLALAPRWPDLHVRHGKMVVEFSAVHSDKGTALAKLRSRVHATAVLYVGDDLTDEDVFRSLGDEDMTVKVGDGETTAHHRVAGTRAVHQLLRRLLELRSEIRSHRPEARRTAPDL